MGQTAWVERRAWVSRRRILESEVLTRVFVQQVLPSTMSFLSYSSKSLTGLVCFLFWRCQPFISKRRGVSFIEVCLVSIECA